jgi:2-methylisocitrate lyase-like PEP mutase family enzyme
MTHVGDAMTNFGGSAPDVSGLADRAERLRSMHRPGDPLVLVNAWDAASAAQVETAGGRAIATSSAAIAASLGMRDDHSMPIPVVFEMLARIVAAVDVPVTADLLDGYGLPEAELVDHLLRAGAVGCNLEDSDHRRPGQLLDPEIVAARLIAVRSAARRRGVDIVVNARIDTHLHAGTADPAVARSDIVRRAQRYLEAGADCVYPIRMTDPATVADLVAALSAPVNANVAPGAAVADLAAAGASRISIGPMAHRVALAALDDLASQLLS